MLLLIAPGEQHVFDAYLDEILLTEGYNLRRTRQATPDISAADLQAHSLVIISAGAARCVPLETVRAYLEAGGRAIVFRPPNEWAPMLGVAAREGTYSLVANGYLSLNPHHFWLRSFPCLDLQCPVEAQAWEAGDATPMAWIAGQLGLRSTYIAAASCRVGKGAAVVFTYDLAECIVRLHQGWACKASDGPNPDGNRDGKFTGDDLFEGMRDYHLRAVPQADVHQDLLVRAIVGLTADAMPLPRLWHHANAAPATLLLDGDSDGTTWEDMMLAVEACERHGAKYTCFLMTSEINSFDPGDLADLRRRGHSFGPHPWVTLQPTVEEWRQEITTICGLMESRFGFRPQAFRSHSCIFPGWDDSPSICHAAGLRLDTNFACGYRYQTGYLNGSALPVKFMDRNGGVIDCYEQSTVHGDDILITTKCMLPPLSEDECIRLSMETMRQQAEVYHGVYHPYFHPTYLGTKPSFCSLRWFEAVLAEGARRGMPAPSDEGWIAFNDARRAVQISDLVWKPGALEFTLASPIAVAGLTLMLPFVAGCAADWARGAAPCAAGPRATAPGDTVGPRRTQRDNPRPCTSPAPAHPALRVTVDGDAVTTRRVPYEGLGWTALVMDLRAGEQVRVAACADER